MKSFELIPENWYSCEYCQSDFQSIVELSFWFFCSISHRYKFFYQYAKQLFPETSKENLFRLTKTFVRWSYGNRNS